MSFSVLAVVGPTASGKSDLGISIAKAIGNAEIVNADAMQLYQGMDIGQPSSEKSLVRASHTT